MTTTYDDMATAIADEIGDSALTSQIQLCIAEARRKYDRRRFYFNQKTGTFSTVASQEYYSSSDLADIPNIVEIDGAKLTVSGFKLDLTQVPFADIDDAQSGTMTGDPDYFCLYKQQIRLYPIPNAVRTVTLAYLYKAAAPVFGSSTTDIWTNEAYDLIRSAAMRILHQRYTKEDDEAQRQGAAEQEQLDALLAETAARMPQMLRTDVPSAIVRPYDIATDR